MNLNQLHYFMKLAELEHFTQAAKELFITQPSLSGSISSLEEELGLELFHRQGRTIKLTKYGHKFYEYVSAALAELEKGIEYAKEESGALGGVIDIGCIPTIIGDYLPTAINDYLERVNSKTKFHVYNGMSLDIIAGLKTGKYDIGFCSFVENEPDIEFIPIMYQELILLVNKKCYLAEKDFLYLDELKSCHLITYRQNLPIGKTIMNILKEHNLHAEYEYDDEITIGGLVSTTPVAAITARTPFLEQFKNLKQVSLDIPMDTRKIYLCYCKSAYHTRPVEIFTNYIIDNETNL